MWGRMLAAHAQSRVLAGPLVRGRCGLIPPELVGARRLCTTPARPVLWEPDERGSSSQMRAFMDYVSAREGGALASYAELHAWSVADVGRFWGHLWAFCDVRHSVPFSAVVDDARKMPGARWFDGARLNFAENLLRHGAPDAPAERRASLAFIAHDELSNAPREWTHAQLYEDVSRLARALRAAGVRPGDRVAGVLPNQPEAAIAMLASVAVGASWASCSPDFGAGALIDRLGQVAPRVVFSCSEAVYRGKRLTMAAKLDALAESLGESTQLVLSPYLPHMPPPDLAALSPRARRMSSTLEAFLRRAPLADVGGAIDFAPRAFDDEVYVMFSSGTTGRPKCMAQGCGVLLTHLKELALHTDLRASDRLFYFSTLSWMMWNWATSALATGAAVVTYDGDPAFPTADRLWRMAADARVSVLGTSARFLAAQQAAGVDLAAQPLPALRAILTTGSPANDALFEYAARAGTRTSGRRAVQVASIAGGTDLNGCFALGCPTLPVRAGELQCVGLGLDVAIFDESAVELPVGARGELVCRQAFPSMPLGFLADADGTRYLDAYFAHWPAEQTGGRRVWRHGDFAERTPAGGLVIHGRSDATLNPGGVRIGTADIYNVLDEHVPAVVDSVVVGQDVALPNGTADVRVLLFVRLRPGATLDAALEAQIRNAIKAHASPRHVPALVRQCDEVPYTANGKKVEIAVKRTIDGQPVTNLGAIANPASLQAFERMRAELAPPSAPR
ncbi:hypothetical protein KFE25_002482 [Diacronema lutheri]|uniref:Acetoacetate--CoA ligase n=1 Tax=Diacronema lutheri TaxID=2081491 RepID=A0A8J5X9M3_DIALT|nr:hypothetical protein KFE25_002482 [Diacronema lutheri]